MDEPKRPLWDDPRSERFEASWYTEGGGKSVGGGRGLSDVCRGGHTGPPLRRMRRFWGLRGVRGPPRGASRSPRKASRSSRVPKIQGPKGPKGPKGRESSDL